MSHNIWAYRVGAFRAGNGWDSVISLPAANNLAHLIQALEGVGARGQVAKLAIVAHGDEPGVIRTDPVMNQVSIFENPVVSGHISSLRDYLEPSAQVLLMSCIAGAGPRGSHFLKALSTFWPGRTVIGFITSGEFNPYHFAAGDVFDTGGAFTGGTVLDRLPRAELMQRRMTPNSASAKWAKNGEIVRLPLAETAH
jgi:hypothetical protein